MMRADRRPHPRSECFDSPPELTGFPSPETAHCDAPEAASERPASIAWITDELLAYTRDVWSRHLGRDVPDDEAVEMLLNVKRLAETILNITQAEGDADESGDMGEGILS